MTASVQHVKTTRPSEASGPRHVMVDPLERPDWDSLLAAHRQATIFHGAGWARVLRQTYGHKPFYICRFQGQQLAEMLPIMEVSSFLTGRRGVSLPFTDFCAALKSGDDDGAGLFDMAMETGRKQGWKYLECRSFDERWTGAKPSLAFYGHVIDLSAGVDGLFKQLESSIRRGVRKAESSGLQAEFSSTPEAIRIYYGLHCKTRQRHGLPPQPFRLFENIQRYILEPGNGYVTIVRQQNEPIAAGVFLTFGRQAIYKFGASDFAFQQLRPNNLMMWAGMRHAAEKGFLTLHLGRSSAGNEGLRRFKLSFGAVEETVQYCRHDFSSGGFVADADRADGWHTKVFSRLPLPLLRLAGRILYPHMS